MAEWIWLVIGILWGLWIDLKDARHYKSVVDFQSRYIKYLHKKIDEVKHD